MQMNDDVCKGCGITLIPELNWPPSCKKHSDYWCRTCRNIRSKQWRKDNPERKRQYEKISTLKSRYNLSYEEYLDMFSKQENQCSICKTEVLPNTKNAHVDHCHTTGIVRSILCTTCNTGLGKFKENKQLLAEAIKYLEFHGTAAISD